MENRKVKKKVLLILLIFVVVVACITLAMCLVNQMATETVLYQKPVTKKHPLDNKTSKIHVDGGMKKAVISLQRDHSCRLGNEDVCGKVNKSLVVTFWGSNSSNKWLVSNIHLVFPEDNYDCIIMLYDSSNWSHHSAFKRCVWIRSHRQVRFWYVKRFLSPHVLSAYNYVWIVDDDAKLTFHPLAYECVVRHQEVRLSSPTRLSGPAFHKITWQNLNSTKTIGRWTDFVEIGPVVVGEGIIWACLWDYFLPTVGAGYGLDLVWCRIIAEKCLFLKTQKNVCGMLDIFGIHHESKGLSGIGKTDEDARAHQVYNNFVARIQNIGFMSLNKDIFRVCNNRLHQSIKNHTD